MGLVIASVRRLLEANAFLRRGEWTGNFAKRMPLVRGLTGRKVGIYGLGAIGETDRAAARRRSKWKSRTTTAAGAPT